MVPDPTVSCARITTARFKRSGTTERLVLPRRMHAGRYRLWRPSVLTVTTTPYPPSGVDIGRERAEKFRQHGRKAGSWSYYMPRPCTVKEAIHEKARRQRGSHHVGGQSLKISKFSKFSKISKF